MTISTESSCPGPAICHISTIWCQQNKSRCRDHHAHAGLGDRCVSYDSKPTPEVDGRGFRCGAIGIRGLIASDALFEYAEVFEFLRHIKKGVEAQLAQGTDVY